MPRGAGPASLPAPAPALHGHVSSAAAVHAVQGTDTETPALVLTLQTAGEALNFNPHLHRLLADGLFDTSGSFTPFNTLDTAPLTRHFADHVLAALTAKELITDDTITQILSQEHSGFGVWVGNPVPLSYSLRLVFP